MKNTVKVLVFFISAISLSAVYALLYKQQIGAPVKAEWWLKETVIKKTDLLSKVKSPERIVIISGSNSLFGFDSSVIEEGTGIPTFNFGLHASLDMSYLSKVASNIAKKGDIFVAPLEYTYYVRKSMYSDWFINNMIAWGADYLHGLDIFDQASFIAHTDARRVFEGLLTPKRRVLTSEHDIKRFIPTGVYRGYSYKSIKRNGDIITPENQTSHVKSLMSNIDAEGSPLTYESSSKPAKYSIDQIIKLKEAIESKGAKLILIWPASIKSESFNEMNESSSHFISEIKREVSEEGIDIHCKPYEFNLDSKYFFDTYYHLNKSGEELRANKVLDCLRREVIAPIHGA
ncbi:hypothetical protein B1H58_15595 [Pantoea alhagi]|uniref:Uncharacterized protein n=1 Tax=Pantoea alhagi TaxID=1891675 RepID=A0A1W6B8B9_9GAMM|nr:hypothetical protein [Pantoea alhagi]ARJ43317.1 hypothetical protein B1H58_15595 [Pantoea alhagi]